MSDEQPPGFVLMQIIRRRRELYGAPAVIAGIVAVIAVLVLMAWALSD